MWDEIVSRLANQLGAELLVAEARRAATATLETEICGQRLSTARTANEPHRWCNRLGRPTDAAASRGNVVLFCGLGITSICADSLVVDAVSRNRSARPPSHLLSREKQGEMQILPVPPPSKRQNLM
jgi:hypothetical protein